jgi:hypothetical protein
MEEAQFESSPELSKFWFVYAWGRHDGNKSLYLVFVGVFVFSASWTAFRAVRTAASWLFFLG